MQYQTFLHEGQGKRLGPSAPEKDLTPHPEHIARPRVGLTLEVEEGLALVGRVFEDEGRGGV